VWSNVIAALTLAGGASIQFGVVAGLAMSFLYVGGMYLNDAFDREIDARERPTRPISSGEASAATVLWLGFAMLAVGVALLADLSLGAGLVGLALAGAIVIYDLHHKANPLSPFLMGLCRALVYIASAAAVGALLDARVLIGACVLFLFVAGLTLAAKQESLTRVSNLWPLVLLAAPLLAALPHLFSSWLVGVTWVLLATVCAFALHRLRRREAGDVGEAVGLLIAAIALTDAVAAASTGAMAAALMCIVLFVMTLFLQRYIPGT
jgi:4-hydroxybenzoate polyprenyltransferase